MRKGLLYLIEKFAKLTDDQYKRVYFSTHMKDILNSKDLLDDFNIALPQYPEAEIKQHYDISKNKSNVDAGWAILSDKKIDEFIKTEGSNKIPADLSKSLHRYIENQEKIELQDDDILTLRRYFLGNVKDLIEDYAFSSHPDANIIYSFIDAYSEIKSENRGPSYSAAVMTLLKNFYLMCMDRKVEETDKYLVKKYEDAIKVRESDMFDFLFTHDKEMGIQPPKVRSKSIQPPPIVNAQKPSVNYGNKPQENTPSKFDEKTRT